MSTETKMTDERTLAGKIGVFYAAHESCMPGVPFYAFTEAELEAFSARLRGEAAQPYYQPLLKPEDAPGSAHDVPSEGSREAAMVVLKADDSGVPTVWCDPEIADIVQALNDGGLPTIASCSGHGEKPFGIVSLKDGREFLILPDWETTRRAERILGAALADAPNYDVMSAEFSRGYESAKAEQQGQPVAEAYFFNGKCTAFVWLSTDVQADGSRALYTRPQPVGGDAVRHRILQCADDLDGNVDEATVSAELRQIAAALSAAPSFGVIESVCDALTRLGVAVPESKEEQAGRADELIEELCRLVPAPVAGDAVRSHMEALYRALASIGIVGVIDEYDVIRRSSVVDIVRRYTHGPTALAQDRASQPEAAPGVPEGWREIVQSLVDQIERETCMHENTHRGGFIWEICDDCGRQWADDRGGRPEFKWSDAVERARAMLAAAPKPTAGGA